MTSLEGLVIGQNLRSPLISGIAKEFSFSRKVLTHDYSWVLKLESYFTLC